MHLQRILLLATYFLISLPYAVCWGIDLNTCDSEIIIGNRLGKTCNRLQYSE
jgi:hypothetical protein